jgi:hypothetical protein
MPIRFHPLFSALMLAACAAAYSPGFAHAESIAFGSPLPRFALLKEGTHHYLRYIQSGDSNMPIDIWTREIRFEQGRMRIRQRWDAAGKSPSSKWLDSWFETGSFKPITHTRITEREGKRMVEGFSFAPEGVTGMPGLADNTQKDLSVATPEPTYNFETDIEFLQALPLAPGYEAQIVFYHGGGTAAPMRYTFKVAGSASIAGPTGPLECWQVTTDYNRPGHVSTFWFAKGSQLMLRQESPMGDGKVLVKTLID